MQITEKANKARTRMFTSTSLPDGMGRATTAPQMNNATGAVPERSNLMAGLERARAQGKRLGRPRTYIDPEALKGFDGLSVREIASRLGTSPATVHRRMRAFDSGGT